jgi:hypothetical protein
MIAGRKGLRVELERDVFVNTSQLRAELLKASRSRFSGVRS